MYPFLHSFAFLFQIEPQHSKNAIQAKNQKDTARNELHLLCWQSLMKECSEDKTQTVGNEHTAHRTDEDKRPYAKLRCHRHSSNLRLISHLTDDEGSSYRPNRPKTRVIRLFFLIICTKCQDAEP